MPYGVPYVWACYSGKRCVLSFSLLFAFLLLVTGNPLPQTSESSYSTNEGDSAIQGCSDGDAVQHPHVTQHCTASALDGQHPPASEATDTTDSSTTTQPKHESDHGRSDFHLSQHDATDTAELFRKKAMEMLANSKNVLTTQPRVFQMTDGHSDLQELTEKLQEHLTAHFSGRLGSTFQRSLNQILSEVDAKKHRPEATIMSFNAAEGESQRDSEPETVAHTVDATQPSGKETSKTDVTPQNLAGPHQAAQDAGEGERISDSHMQVKAALQEVVDGLFTTPSELKPDASSGGGHGLDGECPVETHQTTVEVVPPTTAGGMARGLQDLVDQIAKAFSSKANNGMQTIQIQIDNSGNEQVAVSSSEAEQEPPPKYVEPLKDPDSVDPSTLVLSPLEVQGKVYPQIQSLDVQSFLPMLHATPNSLVLFYLPWDSSLPDLLEHLVRVAPRSLDERLRTPREEAAVPDYTYFRLFAVDMMKTRAAADACDVDHSSTLVFMHRNRKTAHYIGVHRAGPIQAFCERLINLAAIYSTDEALDVVMRSTEVAVVGYFPHNRSAPHYLFQQLSLQLAPYIPMGIVFGATNVSLDNNPETEVPVQPRVHQLHRPILEKNPQFNITLDSTLAMIIKQADRILGPRQQYVLYDGAWDGTAIMNWASKHSSPYIQELTPSSLQQTYSVAVSEEGAIVIMFLSVPKDGNMEELCAEDLERFRQIGVEARLQQDDKLYLLYGTVQRFGAFATRLGWAPPIHPPFFVSLLCHKDVHVITTEPPTSVKQVEDFISAAHTVSSSIVHTPTAEPYTDFNVFDNVVELTAANFNLLVLQDCTSPPITTEYYPRHLVPQQICEEYQVVRREVLVFFHAPWCGYCKATMPAIRELGALVKDLVGDSFMVGEYNCQRYQVPPLLDSNIEGFPEVILFPFLRKSSAFMYQGAQRKLPHLVSFILANSQLPSTMLYRLRFWLRTQGHH